jgi:hypothetical protein
MPAPKTPNTAAATATRRRRGDQTAAQRLRGAGWVVLSPEQVAQLPDDMRAHLDMPEGITDEVIWQYSSPDPDEPDGRMVYDGTPRVIGRRWEQRPLRPAGPWTPVGNPGRQHDE